MVEVSQYRIRGPSEPTRRSPSARRLVAALLLFAAPAVIPPSWWSTATLERPRFVFRLLEAPAPDRVDVPVARVAARDLRDSWGGPRSGGRRHEGIDIFAPRGTPVTAATDGLVWRVGTDPLGGLVVWILGPGRQMHYYAHLDRYADVRGGDHVAAGDVVGYVGTTGNARGGPPHLHYGIYAGGVAIDPYPLLVPRTPARSAPAPAPRARPDRT